MPIQSQTVCYPANDENVLCWGEAEFIHGTYSVDKINLARRNNDHFLKDPTSSF